MGRHITAEDDFLAFPLTLDGNAYVASNLMSFRIPFSCTLQSVKVQVDTAPTGSALILDVNRNGTSIFIPANRPTVNAAGNSGDSSTFVSADLSEGDICSIDVDQVGSTVAGGNRMYITLNIRRNFL